MYSNSTIQLTLEHIYVTFEGIKGYLILEKNNLQTAQEWTKSYIELIASYVHPKTGNHLLSHLRAIMALDHRRLIRSWKKKSGQLFYCVRQVYFAKSCQQIWVRVNQPFIPFLHHILGEKVQWGTVFIIPADLGQKAVFHNTNCTHSIFINC